MRKLLSSIVSCVTSCSWRLILSAIPKRLFPPKNTRTKVGYCPKPQTATESRREYGILIKRKARSVAAGRITTSTPSPSPSYSPLLVKCKEKATATSARRDVGSASHTSATRMCMTVLRVYPTGLTRPDGSPVQSKYASSLSASGKKMERSITQEEALLDSLSPYQTHCLPWSQSDPAAEYA